MRIDQIMLPRLRSEALSMPRKVFVERYPSVFLIAMGFLSAEELYAKTPSNTKATWRVVLGDRLKHEAKEAHPLAGHVFAIWRPTEGEQTLTLGRDDACEVTVPDVSVSENHCVMTVSAEEVRITDNGTTNGTTVNLEALPKNSPRAVDSEDLITLGRYSFQLFAPGALCDSLKLMAALEK